jgi:AAA15 family ATPase/GTPase
VQIELTVQDYRSIGGEPVRIVVGGGGFTSLVGVNNAGKSNLLRLIYELRQV